MPNEQAPYDHDDHGRVRVRLVEDGVVYFDVLGARVHGTGIPLTGREPVNDFEANTTPVDRTVAASDESLAH